MFFGSLKKNSKQHVVKYSKVNSLQKLVTSVMLWCILSVKGQMAIFEEMIEDEEGLVDDRLPTTSRGLWAASETERSLKAVLSFAKAHRMDVRLIEEGNTFLELFEAWKKEYKVQQMRF